MIDLPKLEAALKRLPGFEMLMGCERLSAGASRETYRISARIQGEEQLLALRRAPDTGRSAMGQGPGLEIEAKLFAAARAAGVPGPQVLLVLEPDDGLGSGFAMEWIGGETLGAKIARAPEFEGIRRSLAHQCGAILARLHRTDTAELQGALETFTPEHSVRKTNAAYLELGSAQPMIDFTAKWLLANLPKSRPLTLVHSDFRNGNLIVHPDRGVVAVLDWELAHIGDPMRDLGWLMTRSWRFGVPGKPVGGFGEADDFFDGYESVPGHRVDRGAVRFWEVFGSFWWAVGTLSMAQSWRSGAESSVERPAIGRRSSECQIDCVNMIIPGWARKPAEAQRQLSSNDLPTTSELLTAVRDFLRSDQSGLGEGRGQFLGRVSANALDVVLREMTLGADAEAWEKQALEALLNTRGDVPTMRAALCKAIRFDEIDLKRPDLQAYLRDSVFAQVMIDQPNYAGARECAARA
jgi:aminoglycoside phosphotransferase (APT) family kinase protein